MFTFVFCPLFVMYSKTCVKRPLSDRKLGSKTNYFLMQINKMPEHSAILSTFIKLPFVLNIFALSIFEWPLKTELTVLVLVLHDLTILQLSLKGRGS